LYRQVHSLTQQQPANDCDDHCEDSHGRQQRWIVSLWEVPKADEQLALDGQWPQLRRVIRIDRLRDGSWQTHYYLTSRCGDSAYELGRIIRSHWEIENRLHWVKDVTLNEDGNRISDPTAAVNLSVLKSWALTAFRIRGFSSIKHAMIRFTNKIKELLSLLRT
jgi:hypothetical protein